MSRYDGVLKIVRFNWPWYAGAMAMTAVGIAVYELRWLPSPWPAAAIAALLLADFWLFMSLLVSHYVYDVSPLSRGDWLSTVAAESVRSAAIFHAGQDEASVAVAARLPAAATTTFDFYEPDRVGSESLHRARALATRRAEAIAPDRVPLPDQSLDLGLVVFSAHEIRESSVRAAFFRELERTLRPDGRVIVVEHLRDGWNALAYGPGAFHFLSHATWLRSFAAGGLVLRSESPCTPFVRVFQLGKAG